MLQNNVEWPFETDVIPEFHLVSDIKDEINKKVKLHFQTQMKLKTVCEHGTTCMFIRTFAPCLLDHTEAIGNFLSKDTSVYKTLMIASYDSARFQRNACWHLELFIKG